MTPNAEQTVEAIQATFERGVAIAMDQANDIAIQRGGKATTTLHSYWLHQRCPVCAHTFRLGDEVYLATDGVVRHDSALLPCMGGTQVELQSSTEVTAFFHGLDEAWPPPKDLPVIRLDIGHELLAPPRAGFRRRTCAVCGHTLRLHDHVVICPCSPHEPLCQTAIHRDLIHGLHCLDAWNPSANGQSYCPVTSRKLDE